MTKKVLFIYPEPDFQKEHRFGYSLLLLYLSSSFKASGYDVCLADYSVNKFSKSELKVALNGVNCVVIEIDAFPLKRSTNISNGIFIAKFIKKYFSQIITVAVGRHCTLIQESLPCFNLTISGEPEIVLPNILDSYVNNTEPIFINLPIVADLNLFPYPDRRLLSPEQIRGKSIQKFSNLAPSALIETSRGCPGRCTFCQRKGWGNGLRFFNNEHILKDFESLFMDGIKNIWIVDENFTANLDRAKNILKDIAKIRDNYPVKIAISSWTKIDIEFIHLAKKAGISLISFGIESRNLDILKFYNKKIDFKTFDTILEETDKTGIYTVGSFIIGAPKESEETIQESIIYATTRCFDQINVKTLDYMIGSEIYEILPEEVKKNNIHLFSCSENKLCNYTRSELLNYKAKFISEFTKSNRIKLLKKISVYGPPYFTEDFQVDGLIR